jgi:hypothetical protein
MAKHIRPNSHSFRFRRSKSAWLNTERRTFIEGYFEFLKLFEIEYNKRYVFKPVE